MEKGSVGPDFAPACRDGLDARPRVFPALKGPDRRAQGNALGKRHVMRGIRPERAGQGLFCPFRAGARVRIGSLPGRCPGLSCSAPSGPRKAGSEAQSKQRESSDPRTPSFSPPHGPGHPTGPVGIGTFWTPSRRAPVPTAAAVPTSAEVEPPRAPRRGRRIHFLDHDLVCLVSLVVALVSRAIQFLC
jgi:hypothetical protein